ncbi:MAG: cytochrome c [Acidobacteriota bacterium]
MKIVAMMLMAAVWLPGSGGDRRNAGGHYLQNQAPAAAPAPSGDASRGRTLFDQTYRCYACHGFAGETGAPRLVPMARTEESFTDFVRKPARPAMPAFSDVPAKDLADLYAYLRSLKSTAPAAGSIPLLNDILQQIAAGR